MSISEMLKEHKDLDVRTTDKKVVTKLPMNFVITHKGVKVGMASDLATGKLVSQRCDCPWDDTHQDDAHIHNVTRYGDYAISCSHNSCKNKIAFSETTKDVIEKQFYLCGNDYYVVSEGKIYSKLTKTNARVHWAKLYDSKQDNFDDHITILDAVIHKIDFFNPS